MRKTDMDKEYDESGQRCQNTDGIKEPHKPFSQPVEGINISDQIDL